MESRPRRVRGDVPRTGRLDESVQVSVESVGLGAAPPDGLQPRPEFQGAAGGLSGERQGVANRAADVQRRGRQHDSLERPLPALPPVRLQDEDARRRGRGLAARLRRPRAAFRAERPDDGNSGRPRRHRVPAEDGAPDAAHPARRRRDGDGARLRQARLALVAVRFGYPDDRLRRALRLQQLRSLRRGLQPKGEGVDRRDVLAQGDGAGRARSDSLPRPRDHRRPRRQGGRGAVLRRGRRRSGAEGEGGRSRLQRRGNAAPAAELGLDALPERAGELVRARGQKT